MRIPTLYKKPNWQRFFSGIVIGACISWLIFLYFFAQSQEQTSLLIQEQKEKIKELQEHLSIWKTDYDQLNKQNTELLTIQKITVTVSGFDKYNIKDKQNIFYVEDQLKDDLQPLLTKNLDETFNNKDIVKRTIENKMITINGKKYSFLVKQMYFFTTLDIVVELKLST